VACLFAIGVTPILVDVAARRGGAVEVVAAITFAVTMIELYLISTLYHALPGGRAKRRLKRLDLASIDRFIAGSYMPFVFGLLRGAWGWVLFAVVWTAASLGVAAKHFGRLDHPLWSTALYVAMGCFALVAAAPLSERMSPSGPAWLVGGGILYTAGAVVYLFDAHLRFAHMVWHLFVVAGSSCHVCAALWPATA